MSEINRELTPSDTKNKNSIKFLVILLVLYFVFSQGNLFMNSVFSPGGKYYSFYLTENFNYIQALRTAIIYPSMWVIKQSGFYAIHNDMDILVINGPYMRINYSCLGLGVMSFLAAFIIAFPAKIISKLKIFFIGMLSIYLLNISRISIIGVIMANFSSQRDNFKYHHEVFNIVVYICIFFLLFAWIRKNTSSSNLDKNDESMPGIL